MKKKIAILGSTGSVGTQALEVAQALGFSVIGLSADTNIELLEKQIRLFKPKVVSVGTELLAGRLKKRLLCGHASTITELPGASFGNVSGVEILYGPEGPSQIASLKEVDTVVIAISGLAAIGPVFRAAAGGKRIAMANKEVIVAAGQLLQQTLFKSGAKLIPVDSEQSAIFQCISGNRRKDVSKVHLMASGGPFRGMKPQQLKEVTIEDVLKHPVWKMGKKITVDSATLMNKGLEVIECRWLFDIMGDSIEVVVHSQSIIHSMVEYKDGSVIAQLAKPDMRLPIQYAITWPFRLEGPCSSTLGIADMNKMTFEKPDFNTFPCLRLAYDALDAGGSAPVILNAANETAVKLFLEGNIGFSEIPVIISRVMDHIPANNNLDLENILEIDRYSRLAAEQAARPVKR